MTRAESILQKIYEIEPVTMSIGAATAAAHIAHQVWQAKHKTQEKIRQAGLGQAYDATKAKLASIRKQKLLNLPFTAKHQQLKSQALAHRTELRNITNKGLEKYQAGLAHNPTVKTSAKHTELSTQNPG